MRKLGIGPGNEDSDHCWVWVSIVSYINTCSGKPKIKFRSYNPQTEELKEKKLPKAKPEEGIYIT